MEEYKKDEELFKTIPPRNSNDYVSFLWDTVGGPLRFSGPISILEKKGNTLIFSNNIQINLDDMTCIIASDEYGKGIPESIVYSKNNLLINKKLQGSTHSYSVVLVGNNPQNYFCILMDEVLANSLIVRLRYFNGIGLKYFKPFIEEKDLTRRTNILVYEVDWDAFLKD